MTAQLFQSQLRQVSEQLEPLQTVTNRGAGGSCDKCAAFIELLTDAANAAN